MEITVDRTRNSEGNLIFTITVSKPHQLPFTEEDLKAVKLLDESQGAIATILNPETQLFQDISSGIHYAKDRLFQKLKNSLTFAIDHQVRDKIYPICTEIYNWIYDQQQKPLKSWLEEFSQERIKYYFNNDKTVESDWEEEDREDDSREYD